MASSNPRSGRTGGPVRSIGRSFAFMDPERVREVSGDEQRGVAQEFEREEEPARKPEPARVARGPLVAKQGGSPGGSSGR